MVGKDDQKNKKNSARTIQKIDNGIEAQAYVLKKGDAYWKEIFEWNKGESVLTPKETSILSIACQMPNKLPTEKQALILLNIENKAIEEGLPISN